MPTQINERQPFRRSGEAQDLALATPWGLKISQESMGTGVNQAAPTCGEDGTGGNSR